MERFICENVFVPLRAGPSHKTEMLSQVLFGEKYTIEDRAGSWIKVHTEFDNYSGWIDSDHLQHTSDRGEYRGQVLNRTLTCCKTDGTRLVLEAGCELYNVDFQRKYFSAGSSSYTVEGDFNENFLKPAGSMQDTALRFINSPYIWGGRLPSGLDCSGFTQLVYKIHGIAIPRDASEQSEAGMNIDFIDAAAPGDLVFFDNDRGRITHVGMILSRGLVIHASGRVRVDTIDHQGIFKAEKKGYSHKLRLIRRITV